VQVEHNRQVAEAILWHVRRGVNGYENGVNDRSANAALDFPASDGFLGTVRCN
jgi:hypothetical protein